jgi:carbamoyl-phosphate synthase small subunit
MMMMSTTTPAPAAALNNDEANNLNNLNNPRPFGAWLVLEDGSVWPGYPVGQQGQAFGELVFNTAMTGYQEILTDPSYKGQVVLMTYPELGNYGVNTEDMESSTLHATGLVLRQMSPMASNWRSTGRLCAWLKQQGVVAIEGVDTRALTRAVRSLGAMKCGITTNGANLEAFLAQVKAQPSLDDQDLVGQVTTPTAYRYTGPVVAPKTPPTQKLKCLVALDFGMKANILRCLAPLVEELWVLPATSTLQEILAHNPSAVFLSNGPGDPRRCNSAIAVCQQLVAQGVPLFGICLGHQILSLALGLGVEKMPFGHHGGNHPVLDVETQRISITSQNHGYCVVLPPAGSELAQHIAITHVNLNDQTVEGIRHTSKPVYSVQFHPEAAPGPQDATYLFERFLQHCQQASGTTAPAQTVGLSRPSLPSPAAASPVAVPIS